MLGEVDLRWPAASLCRCELAEGPVWDARGGVLYWTDIRTGRVCRYDPAAGDHRQIHAGVNVGGLRVNRPGGLAFGTWEGILLWRSDQESAWLHHDPKYQFNDVAAGPDGSLYAGSYFDDRPGQGVLYRFRPGGQVEVVAEGLGISNGMGFSPDLRTFYHTDSITRTIYRYDYDPAGDTTDVVGPWEVPAASLSATARSP